MSASSAVPIILMDWDSDGEAGNGGNLDVRLVDDWLAWGKLPPGRES